MAAEYRLHNRYADLEKAIDRKRDQIDKLKNGESERRLAADLCELEIEFQSVKDALKGEE